MKSLLTLVAVAVLAIPAAAQAANYSERIAPHYASGFCDYVSCQVESIEVRTHRRGRTLFNVRPTTVGILSKGRYAVRIAVRRDNARIANVGQRGVWYRFAYNVH